jgi:hypothetical protein
MAGPLPAIHDLRENWDARLGMTNVGMPEI